MPQVPLFALHMKTICRSYVKKATQGHTASIARHWVLHLMGKGDRGPRTQRTVLSLIASSRPKVLQAAGLAVRRRLDGSRGRRY
jgi:hypothetical protein